MTPILAWLVLLFWALAAVLAAWLWVLSREEPESPVEARFGISPEAVRLNPTGYLLEFRFHILDPVLAAEWLDTDGHACLLDMEGGTVFPSLGFPNFRIPRDKEAGWAWGDTRSILFSDPERALKPPCRAAFVLGDARIEDLEIIQAD